MTTSIQPVETRFAGRVRRLPSITPERAVWLFPLASCALAIALFAPRFTVTDPSLVDDWYALTYGPVAVDQILHGDYDAGAVDYGGRYRPAYSVLSYVQWPLLGSAEATTLPTLFGLARLLFFMGVVAALTVVFTRGVANRAWSIVAAAAVPAIVVATPGMAAVFVRFGLVEPTTFAAVALSLVAIAAALRRLAAGASRSAFVRALTLFAAGYVLYLFGLYSWEASVAVVLVLPPLYLWVARSPELRAAGRSPKRHFIAASPLLLAPVGHILSEVLPSLGRGDEGGFAFRALASRIGEPALGALEGAVLSLKTPVWALVFLAVASVCIAKARLGDRDAPMLLSMLAAGALAAYISGFAQPGLGRYYLPWVVGVALAGARLLMELHPRTRVAVLLVFTAFSALSRPDIQVRNWIELDQRGSDAIVLASRAYAAGCPVYLANFPTERRTSIARLLRTPAEGELPACTAGSRRAFTVMWTLETRALPDGCRATWKQVTRRGGVELVTCSDFRERFTIPTQDIGLEDPVVVVRLVKPNGFVRASSLHSET